MPTLDPAIELPGSLRLTPSFPFVGRPRELALLRSLMPRAGGEGRRVALVGGEAGSGKSRLVREFAHEAAGDGVLVLYGACDAVVRIPYQPIAEALDHLMRISDPEQLRHDLGGGGGELTRLLPDLGARVGPLPEPVTADQDTERHRLHHAVAELLVNASHRRPLLVVLEDAHWSDTPTLLLLRHLSRAAADARMLLVATFRDLEADMPAELSSALIDLRRTEGVVPLRLTGLSSAEIGELVERAAGGDLGPDLPVLAAAIHDLTQGNAFLVIELWRALVETGALVVADGHARLTRPPEELGSPEAVREVVSQRLARLDPATTGVLELAAVVGPEFDLTVLGGGSGIDEAALLGAVDLALRSGMVVAVPERPMVYCFAHELVRRALYDRLTAPRRAELHLRAGEAIEAASPRPSARTLADLARHFTAAAPLGGTERAVGYNARAAAAATAALAFDEAVAALRTALGLGVPDARARAEIELALGVAAYRGGHGTDALVAYRAAADIAHDIGDGELFARAAIGFENACWRMAAVEAGALELLTEAAAVLAEPDSDLRVMVLSGLARACAFVGDHDRSSQLRRDAVAMARRLDDRQALATVLMRAYWAKGSTSLDEILAMLTESRDLAAELGNSELQAEAMEWRIAALIALGDLEAARAELAVVYEMASRVGQPFIIHVAEHYRSAIALCDGRLAEAEATAERSFEWGRLLTGRDPSGSYGVQMFGIRREQGRLAELAPVVRILAGGEQGGRVWGPGVAAMLAELGMAEEARRELDRVRRRGLAELRAGLWLASLTYLADACWLTGDTDMAAGLYAELTPHAGGIVTIGHGVACYGSADRYLGVVAAVSGERELACAHLETALAVDRGMGAWTWLAHTQYHLGRLLLADRGGDRVRGRELMQEADVLAERIGMPVLLGRIRAHGGLPARRPPPDGLSPRELQILRLVARGMSNREIGTQLVVSEHTAANHVRSILRKTGCANRTEAASYAYQRGLTRSAGAE
ncbi:MAG TPA: AAA family ATPase [Gaiellales bacterium]|jgi:DNA-binding CsgD family transcriptional regulator/tetratricopeptide (TPR) repeat protein